MPTTLGALVKHHSGALFLISGGARLLLALDDDADVNKLDNNSRIPLLIPSIYWHREIVALL